MLLRQHFLGEISRFGICHAYVVPLFVISCRTSKRKDLQRLNILLIYAHLEVPKLERSRVVKDAQPENISLISVTFKVSKLERSSAVKDAQPENILLISVT